MRRRRAVGSRRRPVRKTAPRRAPRVSRSTCHSIYQITVGEKVYIGYTSRDPLIRLHEHLESARKGKRNKLYNALRKHEYRHSFEVLRTYTSEFRALCGEIRTIASKDAVKNGLNILPGGQGATMEVIAVERLDGELMFKRRSLDG